MARLHALRSHGFRRREADEEQALARELSRPSSDACSTPPPLRTCCDGPELDVGLITLAERVTRDLRISVSPPNHFAAMAAPTASGVSRTVLYRAFRDTGGVMHRVWERRLGGRTPGLALRGSPRDPAADDAWRREHGFRTPAASRATAFRARFGVAPREWRRMPCIARCRERVRTIAVPKPTLGTSGSVSDDVPTVSAATRRPPIRMRGGRRDRLPPAGRARTLRSRFGSRIGYGVRARDKRLQLPACGCEASLAAWGTGIL